MEPARHQPEPRQAVVQRRPAVLAALMLAAWAVSWGCGGGGTGGHELGRHSGLDFLNGLVLSDRAVVAAPGSRWEVATDSGMWTFRTSARFTCLVRTVPERPLVFRFVPTEETSKLSFRASWDDRDLLAQPVRPSPEGSELQIPHDLVTPGLHVLRVSRVGWADPADLRDHYDNVFAEIAYSFGDRWYRFHPDDVEHERYIGMLMAREVTGMGVEKMSGCLFDGPRSATATVELDSSGEVSFAIENASEAPARFSLTLGARGVTRLLAPGELGRIELAAEDGPQALELAVQGTARGAFLWGSPRFEPEVAAEGTPIVLVTLDTTRRDVLTPYGGLSETSPRLGGFARTATVFDNAWAVSPWTLPSHAAIFTGLYPSRHRAGVSQDHLSDRYTTVAELLARNGYLTVGFAGGELSSAKWGLARGFHRYRDPEGFETPGDRLVDAVEQLLELHHPRRLFLFVNLFDPHALYQAPAEFEARFGVAALRERVASDPAWADLVAGRGDVWRSLIAGEPELTSAGLAYLRAAYLAEVAFMDDQLGRLFDLLDGHGLLEPALVAVVADHGEYLGEGGFLSHCCRLDPELMEVPLLVKWPGQRSGGRVAELVSHVDLYSTLLEAAGIEAEHRDGVPLGPDGPPGLVERTTVLMEEHESRIHPLFENMEIAKHLYGLQEIGWREVVWDGDSRCSEGAPGSWRAADCVTSWQERMRQVGELVRLSTDEEAGSHRELLSDSERQSLEALGYVH